MRETRRRRTDHSACIGRLLAGTAIGAGVLFAVAAVPVLAGEKVAEPLSAHGESAAAPMGKPLSNPHDASGAAPSGNAVPNPHGEGNAAPKGKLVPNPHGASAAEPATDVDLSGIERAAGGKTVAEIYDEKAELNDREIAVRGKVVKVNAAIMGRNWLHLRDGSSAASGADDLTVTTSQPAKVGDTVVVRGKVVTDRDFGFGYRYEVVIEDASVTVE